MGYKPNFCVGGTASGCGSTPANCFDGNWGTEFEHGGGYPHYIQYDLGAGNAKAAIKLTLISGTWAPSESPKTFTLRGSNTGAFAGEETILLTVSDAGWTSPNQQKDWTFANTTAFRYYRLAMTAATSGGNYAELEEIMLFEDEGLGADICTGGTPSDKSEISGHEAAKAFDNLLSTFYESNADTSWWLQYDLGVGIAKVAQELTLTSANAFAATFPKNFTLKASNTGAFSGEEVTLLTVAGAAATQSHQQFNWTFANSTGYRYYRVVVSAVQSGQYLDLTGMTLHESLTPPPVSLTIQDLTLAPSLDDGLVLAAKSALTIQDLTLAPSLDNLSLGWKGALVIQDLTLAPSLDNTILAAKSALAIQDLTLAPSIDESLALTAHNAAGNMFLVF